MKLCLWEAVLEAQHTASTEDVLNKPPRRISVRASVSSRPARPADAGSPSSGTGQIAPMGHGLTCLRGRGADDDGGGGHQADGGAQPVPGARVHHQSTGLVVVSGRSQHGVTWRGKVQMQGKGMNPTHSDQPSLHSTRFSKENLNGKSNNSFASVFTVYNFTPVRLPGRKAFFSHPKRTTLALPSV